MSPTADVKSAFSHNRAEEMGYDVWKQYVVPPFYSQLDLSSARKPRLIIGGRGCGKTMLLRYLSHQTMFSADRPTIPPSALSHIGLYWRADTQFASAMRGRGLPEDTWSASFNHLSALMLSLEVLNALGSVAKSAFEAVDGNHLNQLDYSRLRVYSSALPHGYDSLRLHFEEMLWEFEAWVNDVRRRAQPDLLPGPQFVLSLIHETKRQIAPLHSAIFMVYLDEYENLDITQQQIVNTWLKHSQVPLIFNLAMKRNAFETLKTTGAEALSDIHDFRVHDLEEDFEEDFRVMAAEILLLRFWLAGVKTLPVDPAVLRDPETISERRLDSYKRAATAAANDLFPGVPHKQLAQLVFEDNGLSNQLRRRIGKALGTHPTLTADEFFRPHLPEASIITPALLSRRSLSAEDIHAELQKLEAAVSNKFTGPTNWIHNNFVGSLLQLYEPQARACPFYAGFETFCELSHGNLRHFLELCHKSINRIAAVDDAFGVSISPPEQAEAARQTSTALFREVKSFGRRGNQLHTFVLRIGTLFSLAHQRPTLSESEQSHFTILRGASDLGAEDYDFIREAVKWSVVFEYKGTKKKSEFEPETVEYVLNPIYAPFFHISYRKKRRLELTTDDAICLIRGTYSQVSDLLRRYSNNWEVATSDLHPSLFSHLEQL